MSALEKALRQIGQERHARGGDVPMQTWMPNIMFAPEPVAKRGWRRWAVAALVLSLLGAVWGLWLAELLPTGLKGFAVRGASDRVAAQAPAQPVQPPTVAADTAPSSLPPPLVTFSPSDSTPAEAAVSREIPLKAVQDAGADKGFSSPAWHKAADKMWRMNLWKESSRMWLSGLKTENPAMPMVVIADTLGLSQARRQYLAWASHFPVMALPRKGGANHRWVVFAVPSAADLDRTRRLLSLAQGKAITVDRLAQWQDAFESMDMLSVDSASPSVAVTAPSVSSSSKVATPGVAAVQSQSLAIAASPAQGPSKSPAPDVQIEAKISSPDKADVEPPQLSRTEAQRLSGTGPVSSAAKAIDVDFQMVEKSLARGENQAALDAASKLEKYIGENWRTRYLSGVALMGLSRWDQAIAALSRAQDLNPGHVMVALYHSVALQERGEHAKAIEVLARAQESQPLSPELWLNQGHSHQALGHKVEARKAYSRFLELSVNRQDLTVQRTWVQNRLQKDNG